MTKIIMILLKHFILFLYTAPIFQVPVRLNRLALGSVIMAMSSLAPAEKYLRLDVPHPVGFNIGEWYGRSLGSDWNDCCLLSDNCSVVVTIVQT